MDRQNGSAPLKWAVIDIETTGIEPGSDQIIDIGFLRFEGCQLVEKYNSLVYFENEIPLFITKLTGITDSMVKKAPKLKEVLLDLEVLNGHYLIAHNSDFEESFLSQHLDNVLFVDSIPFFALLMPERSSFKLENILIDFSLAEQEMHRGYEDSVDLLKALTLSSYIFQELEPEECFSLLSEFSELGLQDTFWCHFLSIAPEELIQFADTFEFDLTKAFEYRFEERSEDELCGVVDVDVAPSFDSQYIKSLLTNERELQKCIDGYKFRQGQLDMSLRVGQSLKNGIHSMIQAPTGTGKTLAYLIPSSLYSKESQKQVLVATATKTLQEQILKKDLPVLRKLLNFSEDDLKVVTLIGSSNHLCEYFFYQDRERGEDLLARIEKAEDGVESFFLQHFPKLFFQRAFSFNKKQTYDNKITRSSLPGFLKRMKTFSDVENQAGADYRKCLQVRCPVKESCSYFEGIQLAKDADIIVGNHSLMFSWPSAIEFPTAVIVDEAHRLEEEATKQLAVEVSNHDLARMVKSLDARQGVNALFYLLKNCADDDDVSEKIDSIREAVDYSNEKMKEALIDFDQLLEDHFRKSPRFSEQYWNELPLEQVVNSHTSAVIIEARLKSIVLHLNSIFDQLLPYIEKFTWSPNKELAELTAISTFDSFIHNLKGLVSSLGKILDLDNDQMHSFSYHAREGFLFTAKKIDIGTMIANTLLAQTQSTVFTSATLANADGDIGVQGIEWVLGYGLVEPQKRFKTPLFLKPVFDYEKQAQVFLSSDLPAIYHDDYVAKMMEKAIPLVKELGGKTLFLFSSRNRFMQACSFLLKEFGQSIPIYIQGMGANLVNEFKRTGGILVGMESFSEGIDIKGDALKLVVVDKIPDVSMELVTQARRDYYERNIGNEFIDYFMAKRARSLHQKLGRLIRSESDSGAILICDPRVTRWQGRTLNQFFQLMRPYQIEKKRLQDSCTSIRELLRSST